MTYEMSLTCPLCKQPLHRSVSFNEESRFVGTIYAEIRLRPTTVVLFKMLFDTQNNTGILGKELAFRIGIEHNHVRVLIQRLREYLIPTGLTILKGTPKGRGYRLQLIDPKVARWLYNHRSDDFDL